MKNLSNLNIHRLIRIFAIITSIGAYIMVILGVLVTTTDSGQGCGNTWPFCHGEIIPKILSIHTLYEFGHRTASGLDGFLILALTVICWWLYRQDKRAQLLSFMSLFFVILQGVLGALTVVFEGTFAKNWLLSLHFGFSLISFASVILLTVYLFQQKKENQVASQAPTDIQPTSKGLQYAAWGLATYTYLVVYSGALVSHTNSTLGCGLQYPGCGSVFLPSFFSYAGIQLLHRYAASIIGLLTLWFMIVVIRRYRARKDLLRGSVWASALVVLQGVSGILLIFSAGQMLADLLHTTLIAALFCVLSYLCMQLGWPWKKSEQKSTPLVADEEMSYSVKS
jgi:cytochrome c oxidase assembly protein subunit 15